MHNLTKIVSDKNLIEYESTWAGKDVYSDENFA